MKRYIFTIAVLFIICGCSKPDPGKSLIAKVNDYSITAEEFETEFKESVYSRTDTPEMRKEFLNNLIDRKLILQDAERRGIDKDPRFLKALEKFWEQLLLKMAIERKTMDFATQCYVSDKEIRDAYESTIKDGGEARPYAEMYMQIKWDLVRRKEAQLINIWMVSLKKSAKISLNDKSSDIKK